MQRKLQLISFIASLAISFVLFAQPIQLDVDLTKAYKNIFHAELTMPVEAGDLTLYYPKWIPGYHQKWGKIADLTGLIINAGGKTIPWQRDFEDVYTIHCEIPEATNEVHISLDYLLKPESSATPNLAILEWNDVLLYPAGKPVNELVFQARLTLPDDWKFGTALPIESQTGNRVTFAPVSLELLVDSPILCGKHYREIELTSEEGPRHFLSMVSDTEAGLEISPEQRIQYENLVKEASMLFDSHHYKSYRFLLAMSDYTRHGGLEHHESSDNRVWAGFLTEPENFIDWISVLPHELVHSWNGKHLRPIGMATSDFQKIKNLELLWVYEGLTRYLGYVLTARSGLWTQDHFRQAFAFSVEQLANTIGRTWRPLADTPFSHQLGGREDGSFWRRKWDHYAEGSLIWMEIDVMIRQQTGGEKSLDDFCRLFFGGESGNVAVKPYDFDDLVEALTIVSRYDWKMHLSKRINFTNESPPLDGILNSGWQPGFDDKNSDYQKAWEYGEEEIYHKSSLGLVLDTGGKVLATVPDKPADRAGLTTGMTITAVNNRPFSKEVLYEALKASPGTAIELLIKYQDAFQTYELDYNDGARYPILMRDKSKEDVLGQIIRPLTST